MAGVLDDAKWLRRRYIDEHASTREIAKEVDRDPKTVWAALRRHGIPTRPPGGGGPPVVIVGERYSRLVVIGEAPREKRFRAKERTYVCACDCGGEKLVRRDHLRSGAVRSCGCLQRETQIAQARRNRARARPPGSCASCGAEIGPSSTWCRSCVARRNLGDWLGAGRGVR